MFGYVKIHKPELKMKDYYKYKAYYCGLCKTLKERYGRFGQMTLTYDMTFLIILLTSLYESETKHELNRCIVHPAKKHDMLCNEITEYVADMNIILAYYNFQDNWQDDKSIPSLFGAKLLKSDFKKISTRYERQCEAIKVGLKKLQLCEQNNETNLDEVSRCFGEIMAELFVYQQDRWEEGLRKIGFFLGKFIYIIDAYEDLENDLKDSSYNPLIPLSKDKSYEESCKNILYMMMAECTDAFEKMPFVVDIDILRNILYDGVWTAYDSIQKEKNETNEKKGIDYDNGSI